MNLELDLYPIISNKIIRQKDWNQSKNINLVSGLEKTSKEIVLFAHKEVISSTIKTFQ